MDICPVAIYCSDGNLSFSVILPAIYYLPAYAALISGSLSLIGAALNMIAYCAFKDLRKGTAQAIIALLAMADFLLASSYILGASIHLAHGTTTNYMLNEKDCYNFNILCQIQGFMGMWMLGCSFTWTSVLAVHFFLATVCTCSTWPYKLMPVYNIVAWLVPLAYTLPILLLGKLGYNRNFTWTCFIRNDENIYATQWDIEVLGTAVSNFLGYSCVLFTVFIKSVRIGCNLHTYTSVHMLESLSKDSSVYI